MPIQICRYWVGILLVTLALVSGPAAGQMQGDADEKLRAEVATARSALQEHPKFKKYYEHLAENPDTLPLNGPKLAVLLAAEAKTSAAIKDHVPSLLATWQEVLRLAAAGNDYKTAFPAIDFLRQHPGGLLTPDAARLAKATLLAAAASQRVAKPVPGDLEAQLELVRELFKEALAANDEVALPSLLAADAKLSLSNTESANSIQLLLPLAHQALDANRLAAAKLLFDHLNTLVPKTAFGKSRKEFADAIAAARERLTIVESAQQAQETLAAKPLDPAANHAYGMYLLTYRGQWRESLTYLALGNDPAWKKLAADSLEVKTAADKVALADRLAALSKEEHAPNKELARHFYQESLTDNSLVGITRAAVEEKLNALGEPLPRPNSSHFPAANRPLPMNEWMELLPLIDFNQDVVRGFWIKGPNQIIRNAGTSRARMRLPVLLTNCSYDLTVNLQFGEKAEHAYLTIPVGDRYVMVAVDGYGDGKTSFFHRLGEQSGSLHKNAVHRDLLRPNSLSRYEVNVRLKGNVAHLSFSLNGKREFEYEGPIQELNIPDVDSVGTTAQPALGAHLVEVSWKDCQVRIVEGTGWFGRDVPLIKPIPPSIAAMKPTRVTGLRPLRVSNLRADHFLISAVPKRPAFFPPTIAGEQCSDYLFAHAPSKVTYAIPPKSKYFTAYAFCGQNPHLKFIVKIDGQERFSVEQQSFTPVVVEIPEGAKILHLECDSLGDANYDHSCWCFPAFR